MLRNPSQKHARFRITPKLQFSPTLATKAELPQKCYLLTFPNKIEQYMDTWTLGHTMTRHID